MNLKTKLSLYVIGLISMIIFGTGTLMLVTERRSIEREITLHQKQLIRLLAKVGDESLYLNDFVIFNYFERLESERGFLSAFFTDGKNIIQVHSDPQYVGQKFLAPGGKEILVLTFPVTAVTGKKGTAHLHFDQKTIQNHIHSNLVQSAKRVGFIMIIALLFGVLGAIFLAQTLVKPIHTLVTGMKEVEKGRLDPIPFPDRGDELGWMGREINSTIQKLKELDEMKRDFVSGVTHELRSPLMAIESFIAILMKRAKNKGLESDHDLLNTVQNNTTRLRKMIDDLLTTAKIESGKLEIETKPMELGPALKEVYELYLPLSREKGIPFKLHLPPDKMIIMGDHNKIVHILTNLISNAFKFTEKGEVSISALPKKENIELVVSDRGPGLPSSEKEKIFEKFYQGKTGVQNKKGTGLGLAIVKGLVEAHQGRISVFENPGGGAKFIFTLPLSHP